MVTPFVKFDVLKIYQNSVERIVPTLSEKSTSHGPPHILSFGFFLLKNTEIGIPAFPIDYPRFKVDPYH